MKNDFRQLVDRNLSGLQWDEQRQARVLASLEPKGGTTMKRKLTMSLALALAMVMLASVAVAAVVLNYGSEANAKKLAVQAMYDTYDFDRHTLGLFKMTVVEEEQCINVYFMPHEFLPVERIGEYDVSIIGEKGEAHWSYDGKDDGQWQSGELDAPYWGVKQLEAYLAVDPGERSEWLKPYLVEVEVVLPAVTPAVSENESETGIHQKTGDLTLEQAQAYADAALMDVYGMTETEVAAIDHEVYSYIMVDEEGNRVWNLTYGDGEAMYYILLDASSGEIIDIGMSTGGNG